MPVFINQLFTISELSDRNGLSCKYKLWQVKEIGQDQSKPLLLNHSICTEPFPCQFIDLKC